MSDHERYSDSIAPYLLGALPDLEAEVLERHVLRCPECSAEVERLRGTVEALPASVPQVAPPPGLKERLMAEVRADAKQRGPAPRRASAWLRPAVLAPGLAASAVVLGLAGYGASQLGGGSGSAARTVAAAVDRGRLPADARARLVVLDGGRAAILRVGGLPAPGPGRVYQVWLRRGARVEPGPTFTVGAGGSGAAAVPDGVRGARAVMVTNERAGGATAPTEAPLITVAV